jgi:WXG100 family type VII secretion target
VPERTPDGDGSSRARPGSLNSATGAAGRPSLLPRGRERLIVPNVNITHAEMQSAVGHLRAGEQTIKGDLGKLKRLVDSLMTSRCVIDTSSTHFHGSYTQFSSSATRMIQGLNGMAQYLDTAVKAFGDTDAQLAASLGQ